MPSDDQQALLLRLAYLMQLFLFLALGLGVLLPTTVNAETNWLVLKLVLNKGLEYGGIAVEKIEMESMAQCEEQGQYWRSKKPNRFEYLDYVCLKGK